MLGEVALGPSKFSRSYIRRSANNVSGYVNQFLISCSLDKQVSVAV
jgi:hypothetical protein